jgi:DNA-directed RNA polymerase specialized sigma subunit
MANELRGKQIKILRRQEDRNKRLLILLDELSKITNRQFSVNEVLTTEQIDEHQIQLIALTLILIT